MTTFATLEVLVSANTSQALAQISAFEGQVKRRSSATTSALTRTGVQLSVALTAPIVAAGKAALTTATNVELLARTASSIAELSSGNAFSFDSVASGSLKFAEQAADIAREVKFTTTDIANAQVVLSRAGFTSNTLLAEQGKLVKDVAALAASANLELAETADIASKTLGAFGFTTEAERLDNFSRISDVLNVTASSSATNIRELGSAIVYAGPLASTLGIEMEELSASLGTLADAGFRGTLAGTGLRAIFKGLAAPTDADAKIIKDLGVQVNDASGNFIGLTNVLEQFQGAFAGLTNTEQVEVASKLFGQRGGPAFINLVKGAGGELQRLESSLNNAGGATAKLEQALLDTASGQFALLRSAFEALSLNVSNSGLLDFTRDLAERTRELVNDLSEFVRANPAVTNAFLSFAAAAAAIGPSLVIFGTIGDVVIPAIGQLIATIPKLLALTAPFVAIAGGIGFAIQQSQDLRDELGLIGKSFLGSLSGDDSGIDTTLNALSNVAAEIAPRFLSIGDSIAAFLANIRESEKAGIFFQGFIDALGQIPELIANIEPRISNIITNLIGVGTEVGPQAFQTLGTALVVVGDSLLFVVEASTSFIDTFGPVIRLILQAAEGVIKLASVIPGATTAIGLFAGALLFRNLTGSAGPLNFLQNRLTSAFKRAGDSAELNFARMTKAADSVDLSNAINAQEAALGVRRNGTGDLESFGFNRGDQAGLSQLGLSTDQIGETRKLDSQITGLTTSIDKNQRSLANLSRSSRDIRTNFNSATKSLDKFKSSALGLSGTSKVFAAFKDGDFDIDGDGRLGRSTGVGGGANRGRFTAAETADFLNGFEDRKRIVAELGGELDSINSKRLNIAGDVIGDNKALNNARGSLAGINKQATSLSKIKSVPFFEQTKLLGQTSKVTTANFERMTKSLGSSDTELLKISQSIKSTGGAFVDQSGRLVASASKSTTAVRGIGKAMRGLKTASLGLGAAFAPLLLIEAVSFGINKFQESAREAKAFEEAVTAAANSLAELTDSTERLSKADFGQLGSSGAFRDEDANTFARSIFGANPKDGVEEALADVGLEGVISAFTREAFSSSEDIDFSKLKFEAKGNTEFGRLLREQLSEGLEDDEVQFEPGLRIQEIRILGGGDEEVQRLIEQALASATPENRLEVELALLSTLDDDAGIKAYQELLEDVEVQTKASVIQLNNLEKNGNRFQAAGVEQFLEAFGVETIAEFQQSLDRLDPGQAFGVATGALEDIQEFSVAARESLAKGFKNATFFQDMVSLKDIIGDSGTSLDELSRKIESFGADGITSFERQIRDQESRADLNESLGAIETTNDEGALTLGISTQDLNIAFGIGEGTISQDIASEDQAVINAAIAIQDNFKEDLKTLAEKAISGEITQFELEDQASALNREITKALEPFFGAVEDSLVDEQFLSANARAEAATVVRGQINELVKDLAGTAEGDEIEVALGKFTAGGSAQEFLQFFVDLQGDVDSLDLAKVAEVQEVLARYGIIGDFVPVIDYGNFTPPEGFDPFNGTLDTFSPTIEAEFDVNPTKQAELQGYIEGIQVELDVIEKQASNLVLEIDVDPALAALNIVQGRIDSLFNNSGISRSGPDPTNASSGAANGGVFGTPPGFANGGLVNFGQIRVGETGQEVVLPSPRTKPFAFERTLQEAAKANFFGSGSNSNMRSSQKAGSTVNYSPTNIIQGVSADQVLARLSAKEDEDLNRLGVGIN